MFGVLIKGAAWLQVMLLLLAVVAVPMAQSMPVPLARGLVSPEERTIVRLCPVVMRPLVTVALKVVRFVWTTPEQFPEQTMPAGE